MNSRLVVYLWCALLFSTLAVEPDTREKLRFQVSDDYAYLESLYKHLHAHPELSLMEAETGARIGDELEKAGLEVTRNVGGQGVVGVLRNGDGPVLLLRADLDGLPIREATGLPFASTVVRKNFEGEESPAMHACGHDVHMTVLVGAARLLARQKDLFRGTLVLIGQPAEERGAGAKAMLKDGLFDRFPKPHYCLAFHVNSAIPAGQIGFVEGYALANVDSMTVTVRGVGGHGAYPYAAKDPIVLAAQTVLALQTIVSREIKAIEPAVLTVGSIHGGTKHNIIPDSVRLQITLRSYSDAVRQQMISSVHRIARGLAEAAGVPQDRMPVVELEEAEFTPSTYNDPQLTKRWVATLADWIGPENLVTQEPVMGGEDFGLYGRTADKIPICMLWLGSVSSEALKQRNPPAIHSAHYKPLAAPTIQTGVIAFAAAVLDLLGTKTSQ